MKHEDLLDKIPECCNPGLTVKKATEEDKKALLDKVDCFIFDCDGTLNHGQSLPDEVLKAVTPCGHPACLNTCSLNVHAPMRMAGVIWRGDSVIEGVPETLDALRALVRQPNHQALSTP